MPRTCSTCHVVKDDSAFVGTKKTCTACLEKTRDRRAADPVKTKAIQHANYMAHREARKAKQRLYRQTHQDEVRGHDRARYPARREDQLLYLRDYRAANAIVLRAKKRVHRAANREAINAKAATYRQARDRRERSIYNRAYRAAHLQALHAKSRVYRQAHPEIFMKAHALRRARKRNAPRIEVIHHIEVATRDNWTCHICHRRVTRKTWSIDHLIPLVDGGSHTMDNIALAHSNCNAKRGARRTIPTQLRLLG